MGGVKSYVSRRELGSAMDAAKAAGRAGLLSLVSRRQLNNELARQMGSLGDAIGAAGIAGVKSYLSRRQLGSVGGALVDAAKAGVKSYLTRRELMELIAHFKGVNRELGSAWDAAKAAGKAGMLSLVS